MITSQVAYFADLGSKLILVLLFFASFLVVAFYIERKLFFKRKCLSNIADLLGKLDQSKDKAEVEKILKLVNSVQTTIILNSMNNPKADNREKFLATVSTEIEREKKNWEKFLLYFATVGSNAPFLGLLGTVLGLMQSFSDLALSEKLEAKIAMAGISNALITTVAGIVIAIPSVVIYNSFSKKVKHVAADTKAIARRVANTIFP